jgi:multiple sugar transport system substrate-binding protein
MYAPLYSRLAEFKEREGIQVETTIVPTHPDLISTHTKYAPSQKRWLTPLDDLTPS